MGKRLLMALSHQLSGIKSVFGFDDSSAEKEEKAVEGVKKEPIAGDQFLQKLKQKKSDKQLNIEVRVSIILSNLDRYVEFILFINWMFQCTLVFTLTVNVVS